MNKFNFKSLGSQVFTYIVGFAIILLVLVWVLQSFFLNTYYEKMKVDAVERLAENIESNIKNYERGIDIDALMNEYATSDDYNVAIEFLGQYFYFSPNSPDKSNSDFFPYSRQIATVKEQLLKSNDSQVSIKTNNKMSNTNTLAYAKFLPRNHDDYMILYIFSPLYPVDSTVDILRNQLVYITAIALIISFLIAFFISKKFTRPIKDVTETAVNLGKGNYNIHFNEGGYTEIDNLSDTLNTVTRELQQTDTYRIDLMANVSHDLKTPLTMIKSYAELIRDISGDNKLKREEHLQVIIDETDRLNQLVTDMLSVTKMQSGRIELNKTRFRFNTCLDTVLETYKILCMQNGYKINFERTKQDFYVYGDEERIKQVITNLINNAVKYGGEDKLIILNLKKVGRYLHFEVKDNGIGIKKEEISHVWDRYYKSSANHVRSSEGSGLGLSICKEILNLHDMNYGVESQLGRGSTFWFEMEIKKSE